MTIGGGTYGYYTNSTNKTYGIPFSYEAMFDANYSTNYAYVDATVDVELCEVSSSTDFSSPFVSNFYGGGASNSRALVTYDIFSPSGINASIFFMNAPSLNQKTSKVNLRAKA